MGKNSFEQLDLFIQSCKQENCLGLTTREWRLYDLLRSNPDKWFTQKEICEVVEGYNYNDNPTSTSDHCSLINADRILINRNMVIDKIIVCKNYKFKIATKEEAIKEIKSHIRRLLSQAEQIRSMEAKIYRNGQCELFNSLLNELNVKNEQYHETFKGENNE